MAIPITLTIDPRFCGPPESANGGYVCGLLANYVDGVAQVTLRQPPPLDTPLTIEHSNGHVALQQDETLIAEAKPTLIELDLPEPVTLDEAEAAAKACEAVRDGLPYPTCFVCGTQRAQGDGMRIFPGPVDGRDLFAATWTPDETLSVEGGAVRPEFIWSALDCPGIFPVFYTSTSTVLLGRLTAKQLAPVRVDERYIVMGWTIGEDGRKIFAGTAIYAEDGAAVAFARATWLRLAEQPATGKG